MKPRAPRREEREAPPRRWPVVLLSGAGAGVSGYLGVTQLAGGAALFCTVGSGCDVVRASRYAVFLGLPTALWGAGLYGLIGGLVLSGLLARRWSAVLLLSVVGVSFSLYLTYLELFVIKALCAYCLVSAGIALVLFGVLLWQRPIPVGRRSPVRTARIASLGAITAVVTVVIGAAIFAMEAPREAAPYQDALARHLAASGAIMYGAYW